jgi:hypothetical protein
MHNHFRLGFGDLAPKSPATLALFPLYAIFGLFLFALLVTCVRQVILEFLALSVHAKVQQTLTAMVTLETLATDEDRSEFQKQWVGLLGRTPPIDIGAVLFCLFS